MFLADFARTKGAKDKKKRKKRDFLDISGAATVGGASGLGIGHLSGKHRLKKIKQEGIDHTETLISQVKKDPSIPDIKKKEFIEILQKKPFGGASPSYAKKLMRKGRRTGIVAGLGAGGLYLLAKKLKKKD